MSGVGESGEKVSSDGRQLRAWRVRAASLARLARATEAQMPSQVSPSSRVSWRRLSQTKPPTIATVARSMARTSSWIMVMKQVAAPRRLTQRGMRKSGRKSVLAQDSRAQERLRKP